ncbi:MAG: hypothetical protein JNM51_08110, partial [Bacteroidia bacterium]|nr:hypothetical protein [Bacteroidia bacterium]
MKYFFTLSIAFLSFIKLNAQTHYCAEHKAKHFNKNLSSSKVQSSASVTAPAENMYDLKFYHLNLNIERNSLFVSGNVKSLAKVVTLSLDSFAFVLHENHTIDSVYVNGAKRNFVRRDSLVLATAGTPIPQ